MRTTPSVDDLRLLTLVGETGSISSAARELDTTQQAASLRVRALERELGATLVHRTAGGSHLTDAGALVVTWAADLLDAAGRLDVALESLRARQAAPVRVAASLTVAEHLVPVWLLRLRERDPQARVELTAVNSAAVVGLVHAGSVDLGFVETPDLPHDVHRRTVGHDELVVVVRPGHPWARRRRVDAARLAATPLAVREAGSGTRQALDLAFAAHGLVPVEPATVLPTVGAIRATVRASDTPAVLSRLAVRDAVAAGVLVAVAVPDLPVVRPLTALWTDARGELPRAARHLLDAALTDSPDPGKG